jgi:peptidoglycan/LPS O-acetylase OafA/YrhL
MYALVAAIGVATRRGGIRWTYLAFLGIFALGWCVGTIQGVAAYPLPLPGASRVGLVLDGMYLSLFGTFFFAGSCLYLFRNWIRLSVVVVLLLALATWVAPDPLTTMGALWLLLPYAMLVFAYRAPVWLRRFGTRRDLSYGIYIYAFPVQQTVSLFATTAGMGWLPAFIISSLLTIALAALSWHYVERRALRWKPPVPQTSKACTVIGFLARGD